MRMLQEHCCLVFICIMMITRRRFKMASNLIEEVEGNGMYRLYTRDEYIPAWDLKNTFGTESLLKLLIVQMIMEDEVHWHI